MDYQQASECVSAQEGLDEQQAKAFLELLMSGDLAEAEGARLLTAMAERGETATELAAFVRGLRTKAVQVRGPDRCCDICGTGGSGMRRFNISTTAAFVLAAVGIPVAKHGNRGSKVPNGSFDLLEALDIPIDLAAPDLERLLRETDLCFLFARTMHPAVGAVVPYRKAAGRRTIFNLAGPLANPVTLSQQVIGTVDAKTRAVVADAIVELGTDRALVLNGHPGIDELSVTGRTDYTYISGGERVDGSLDEPICPGVAYDDLPGGEATENAAIFNALMEGAETGPIKEMLCESAGAAIDLWHGRRPTPRSPGYAQACDALASGDAAAKAREYRERAKALAGS